MTSNFPEAERPSRPPTAADESLAFAVGAARLAQEYRAEDVTVIDVRGLSSVWDFFVIGTGTSERQMHAVVDRIEDWAAHNGRRPFKLADSRQASWILADYVDVAIHLFDAAHRRFYDLDGLWGDAPRIGIDTGEGSPASD